VLAYQLFGSIQLADRPAAAAAAAVSALLALGVALAVLSSAPRLRAALAPAARAEPGSGRVVRSPR